MLQLDREQVLAYRIAAHGLHRQQRDPQRLAVFELGVQDVTARDSAELALAARLPAEGQASLVEDGRFTLAWTHRGAPHYHRTAEIAGLIPALLPLNDDDALARLGWQRKEIAGAELAATDVLLTAARAMRKAVPGPMTKGEASTAVTKLVPPAFTRWCRPCQATHIHEQLMRLATPLAGIRLVAGATPATLVPLEDRPPIPVKPDIPRVTGLVEHYLRLHGPALPADAAGFLGSTRATVAERLWPSGLAEVSLAGKPRYLPADRLAALENPPEPDVVRLLPPWDPFLQARDRELLVPDQAHRKELWKILGNPGAILAGGEVVGTWRTKSAGKRLEVTMTELLPLGATDRAAAEAEATRVAAVRGAADLRVVWS